MRKFTSKHIGDIMDEAYANNKRARDTADAHLSETRNLVRTLCMHDETLSLRSGQLFCRGCHVDLQGPTTAQVVA